MEFDFLPQRLADAVFNVGTDKLYEIRLRKGYAVSVNHGGKKFYLGDNGLTNYESAAIKCDGLMIDKIINCLTEFSFYAFNENVKKGFLTSKDGIRVGIAGDCVFDKEIITVKNICSLNIRIPHEINGCSDCFFSKLKNGNDFYNSLIISPPFCGKTTILKDIAVKINTFYDKNIFIIDERGEFASISGVRIDSLRYSDKAYAFDYGVRSMAPEIIITDELVSDEDWDCVYNAVNSGVKIISSCHASSLNEVVNKKFFKDKVFSRYVVLKGGELGRLLSVCDENFYEI